MICVMTLDFSLLIDGNNSGHNRWLQVCTVSIKPVVYVVTVGAEKSNFDIFAPVMF